MDHPGRWRWVVDGCGGEHIFLVVGERQSTIAPYLCGVVGGGQGWEETGNWGGFGEVVCEGGGSEG